MMKASSLKIWKPHKGPQEIALRTAAFEILYGGARGPGKTDAGIVWLQKPVNNPRYRGLVIRKNADDLKDWIDRATFLYSGHNAKPVGKPAEFKFPSGAIIRTGHLKDDNAYTKYQGHEYQRMLIEELTHIPRLEWYLMLIGSCRSTVDDIDPRVFNTSNPGNAGHQWVKKRFIDVAPAFEKYIDPVTEQSRVYIPGKVTDNPTLMQKDPRYMKYLEGLPEPLRSMWLEGNWDVFAGQYFDFQREYHVYNPSEIKILPSWPRFRNVDWGHTSPMACYWNAVGPDQHLYTYREYYETGKLDVNAAKEIKALTTDEEVIAYTVGDPQSFPVEIPHLKYGKLQSVKRSDVWAENGIPMIMGDSARILGWSRMREYLRIRDYQGGKSAWWHISSACPKLIEELQGAYHDKKHVEDVSSECSDHALEAMRLGMMSRPRLFVAEKPPISMLEAAERQLKREEEQQYRRIGAI